MDVTLTEQIKLTFPSDGQRKAAEQAFSVVTKRYAEACTYVDEITDSDPCRLKHTDRNLLNRDEVRRMKPGKVICMIAGYQPLYDDCYDISTHPNYTLWESMENPTKP